MAEDKPDISSINLSFLEDLYEEYLRDPQSVAPEWGRYFEQMGGGNGHSPAQNVAPPPKQAAGPPLCNAIVRSPKDRTARCTICGREQEISSLQYRVDQFIRNYRVRGHRMAKLDPLGLPRPPLPELDPEYHGFTEADMDILFSAGTLGNGGMLTLRQIIERLRNTYCRSIGVQFMHVDNLAVREWLQERMEGTENRLALSRDEQIRIFTRLTDAAIFEEFIQKKYIGAKSFSLEGGESLIPLLDLAIEKAGAHGINEIVMGMAHRGRLNVLVNILHKSARLVFREFEDADPEMNLGRGDVKYHLGYHNDWMTTSGHPVHVALCFNPSHLEFVNPVALGRVRAKQDRMNDLDRDKYMTILIHGDAAFAGEGVVQETLNLSELEGYCTGGALHVVVNNQIGFTTTPQEARSSTYASDIAKMLQTPIFHVNGEDPEAVAQVVNLAMDFRRTFKQDVVIDMYCYRRRGHNEGDEPSFTQPVLYQAINARKSVRDGYLEHLLKLDEVTPEEADQIAEARRAHLEKELQIARKEDTSIRPSILGRVWKHYHGGLEVLAEDRETAEPKARLAALLERLTELPEGFRPHPKIERWLEARRQMARGEKPLDWAAGEALAYATLATEGWRVRLSGQDVQRGTFTHRHAVLHDYENGGIYTPLQHLAKDQAPVEIFNSPLSEVGVLGFEYGYSVAYPDGLVMWEAQFGDFVNVAQVIIDQFLISAEDKWNSLSGLVLMLPHGLEGMGPEHSSARLERFLMLAAEDNMQIVVPTTPAQLFHVLRRQVLRSWRKPLIIMTPKSLLRHPKVVSNFDEFEQEHFRRILPDTTVRPEDVKRVLLCSGKIYYELEQEREAQGRTDVAILRVEELYPLQDEIVRDALAPYADGTPAIWVQEEPENMGAWRYLLVRFGNSILGRWPFSGVTRPASASPATGSSSSHKMEQRALLTQAFGAEKVFSAIRRSVPMEVQNL
ncbi:MAG: 2-oxoglutarate dehydrogenase E1 component [FCB group bacterium]|nr:2-oxoglutarate dehydrogenase E1 component [FCB group bacterium]